MHDSVSNHGEYGEVVFRCRFRRLFAILIVGVGGFFAWMMLDALFFNMVLSRKSELGYSLLFGGILLVALMVFAVGLLLIWRPAPLFDVTDRGVIVYPRAANAGSAPGFLPWERVRSLQYVRRRVRVGNEMGFSWFVQAELLPDDDWRGDEIPGYAPEDRVILLDALSGSPSGKRLLARMDDVRSDFRNRRERATAMTTA